MSSNSSSVVDSSAVAFSESESAAVSSSKTIYFGRKMLMKICRNSDVVEKMRVLGTSSQSRYGTRIACIKNIFKY